MARFPLPSPQLMCFTRHPSAFLSARNFYKPSRCFLFSHFKIKIHLRAVNNMVRQVPYCTSLSEGYTFQMTRNVLHKMLWLRVWSSGVWSCVVWLIGTNVLEESAATIFITDLDTMKKEAAGFSETLLCSCSPTCCQVLEDCNFNI
jgi:hypothetical protein